MTENNISRTPPLPPVNENSFETADNKAISKEFSPAVKTVFYGGLVVGILDGLFALIFYSLILGAKPSQIFQTIAAGLLGKSSYEGGNSTVLLGLLLHFVVAACIAAVYYAASLKLSVLTRYAVVSGLIYGIIAFLGLNYVVIPLSAAGSAPFSLSVFLTGLVAHAFLVGLPISLLTKRFAKSSN